MNTQTQFARALLDPELACPAQLVTWNGSDPATRFAVYRNNVTVSLIDALADTFPVVQALVGEEFFRAMARVFAQTRPPLSRVLAFYGTSFADFVATFAPAADLAYLPDVARLEMARVLAYHAADVQATAPDTLQQALADPRRLLSVRLVLHPSVQVVDSAFAIYSLWAAHQGELCISGVDPQVAQTVLIYREGLETLTRPVTMATGTFVQALQHARPLMEAVQVAVSADSHFDLTSALALLIRCNLITHVTSGDPDHVHPH